jgi:hypothetical protein
VLFFLWKFVTVGGFDVVITALKSDHSTNTSAGNVSAHSKGWAVDMGNFALGGKFTELAMCRSLSIKLSSGFHR